MRSRDAFPQQEPVAVRCAACGAVLLLAPAEARKRRYCSLDCAAAARAKGPGPRPPGHATLEGRATSQANLCHDGSAARAMWAEREHAWVACLECGEPFATRALPLPLYCSDRCRQRSVLRQRRYTITATCQYCRREFVTSKYRPKGTCSKSCAKRLYWAQRNAGAAS
jgi:hypothetical protein